jgi:tetratricopeptide (TPR) repeat protein
MGATLLESVVDFSNASVTVGANLLVQSALLAGGGLLVAWLLRHKGAALRSTILRVTLMAILVCPLASLALQAIGVPGLAFNLPRAAIQPVEVPARAAATEPVEFPMPVDTDVRTAPLSPADVSVAAQDVSLVPAAGTAAVSSDAPAGKLSRLGVFYVAVATLWWAIAGALLVRLLLAHVRIMRVRRNAVEASSHLSAMCEALAQDMETRSPTVLSSPLVRSPCLVGVLRPAILLPASNGAADPVRSREVILHELIHMARRDCMMNLCGRIARAVLFFQPLLVRLTRRIEDASDDLADDYVIQHRSDRWSYAQLLLDIAKQFEPTRAEALAGVGVINLKWSLERRVRRILDTTRDLSIRIGLRTAVAVIAVALCATLGTGLISAGDRLGAYARELLETVQAHNRAGEAHELGGEYEQAIGSYHNARQALETLVDEFPEVADYRKQLAESYIYMSRSHFSLGEGEEAEQACRRAIDLSEKLLTEFGEDPAYRDVLAHSHRVLGAVLEKAGRFDEAEQAYSSAFDVFEVLVREFPNEPEYKSALAGSHTDLGWLLENKGELEEAERAYRSGLALREELAREFPNVSGYRANLATSHDFLGGVLEEKGELEEAEQACRTALDMKEELVREFPNVPEYGAALARSHGHLGGLLEVKGELEEAEQAYRTESAMQEELAREFPNVSGYRVDLAYSHNNLAGVLQDKGELDPAAQAWRTAFAVYDDLLREFPEAPARGREFSGDMLSMIERRALLIAASPDVNLRDAASAVELAKKAVQGAPEDGAFWNTLALAHYRAGQWEDTITASGKARELRAGGHEGIDLFFIAMAHWQLGKEEEARQWYDQAVEWMEQYEGGTNEEDNRRFRAEAAELLGISEPTDGMEVVIAKNQ